MNRLPNNYLGFLRLAGLAISMTGLTLTTSVSQAIAAGGKADQSAAPAASAIPDGAGIVAIEVDPETGRAKNVTIERSSGDRRYDELVVDQLRKHRYKKHSQTLIRVPFSTDTAGMFTRKDVQRYLSQHGVAGDAVLSAPPPRYPWAGIVSMADGRGRYRLTVSPNGQVTTVTTVQSSGVGRLDNAAIVALRGWRFRPGAVKTVLIPIHFKHESGFFRILLEE